MNKDTKATLIAISAAIGIVLIMGLVLFIVIPKSPSQEEQWEIKLHLHEVLEGKDGSDLLRLKEIDEKLRESYSEL